MAMSLNRRVSIRVLAVCVLMATLFGYWMGGAHDAALQLRSPSIFVRHAPSHWATGTKKDEADDDDATESSNEDGGDDNDTDNDNDDLGNQTRAYLKPKRPSVRKRQREQRWSVIPQGYDDNEPYDDVDIHSKCQPISFYDKTGAGDAYNKPWWLPKLVYGKNECGQFKSMKKCHKSSLTCQWALQGYCFNYTAPAIGMFFSTVPAVGILVQSNE
jgi:hypothetical protein